MSLLPMLYWPVAAPLLSTPTLTSQKVPSLASFRLGCSWTLHSAVVLIWIFSKHSTKAMLSLHVSMFTKRMMPVPCVHCATAIAGNTSKYNSVTMLANMLL
ncbi:hypothetical protein COO60DRAFT_1544657, partial [Scenedesmus sp. NREL 46B-D3]